MRRLASLSTVLGLAIVVTACTPGAVAGSMTKAPTLEGSALCRAGRTNPSPLVVEWSGSARAQFEALAKNGLIVARYDGCELQVLTQCRAPGAGYRYTSITPKNEVEQINGEDELRAKIPLGAAQLAGDLRQSGQLVVDSTVVGRFAAENVEVRESALVGRCVGATHVVSGLTVGAFELSSGASTSIAGGADVLQFGGHGHSKYDRKILSHDGDARACLAAPPSSTAPAVTDSEPASAESPPPPAVTAGPPAGPPAGCGALIRIDLAPLPEAEARFAAEDKRRDEDLAERQDAARTRRRIGWIGLGAGVGLFALAGTFALLGEGQNSDIQQGGFATKDDIKAAEESGTTYNTLGWIFAASGGVALGAGIGFLATSGTPTRADGFMTPARRIAGAK